VITLECERRLGSNCLVNNTTIERSTANKKLSAATRRLRLNREPGIYIPIGPHAHVDTDSDSRQQQQPSAPAPAVAQLIKIIQNPNPASCIMYYTY
jgi:hypothetical protein